MPTDEVQRDQLLDRWNELESEHARVREALEHRLQREHRLSLTEYEVLRRLSDSPEGHRRIQELAEEIHLSQSALSRLVQRLEDDGRKAQVEAHPTQVSALAETLGDARV